MILHEDESAGSSTFLGVWEEVWHERAALAAHAERFRSWLRSQGVSRDAAADHAARLLAANPPTFPPHPPATDPTIH